MKFTPKFGAYFVVLAVMAGLIAPAAVSAQQTMGKFGFIDLQEVFEKSVKFQRVRDEVKQEMRAKADKIKQLDDQFKAQLQDFKVKRDLLPSDKIRERELELRGEYAEILGTIRTEEEQFAEYRNNKLDPVIEELKVVVEQLAKREGYSFIFKRDELAYGDPRFDITQQVIDMLNRQ